MKNNKNDNLNLNFVGTEGANSTSGKSDGASTSSQEASATPKTDASGNGKGLLGLKILFVGLLVGLFMGFDSST